MFWNSSLETKIPQIDEQHKELFRQLEVLIKNSNSENVKEVVDFLGDYVIKHFSDEQMFHTRTAYPKAAEHRALHAKFVASFKELKKETESAGASALAAQKIGKVVVDWLKQHIMVHDQEFAKYYKSKEN